VSLLQRLQIPIWGEGRMAWERAALRRDPVLRGAGAARGHGEPVLLIPGFMAGDLSLGIMARWLRDLGYRPTRARMWANVDCTEAALGRLIHQLEAACERHGRPALIVGQSRGGTMARILAVRRPDLVHGIVTLGSPHTDPFAVHPLVRAQVRAVATLGSLGVPGLFAHRCRTGCCVEALQATTAPFPDGVGFTSIYSLKDGIVDWRSCLDPYAEHVEVRASHIGMAVNAEVYRAIADTFGAWTGPGRDRAALAAA
jgi:pimeloyl-ACP methyl ester carboxylesterase